ncbi:MAG: Gfo/Idh/MocA family oxidoreductase, partial [Gemmatimonadaceae bacterium]|nr:Gfo/Idh/MocA family oxidoreductase [Gemmatimonadaceae bacterium]
MNSAHDVGARLRVAIVGAGKMGQHHARAVARCSSQARIVAVVDPSPQARELTLQYAEGARGYASLRELLASERVDLVHVCTAPHSHEAVAIEALEAGCHIYVEKPFMQSVAVADRVISLAQARGLSLCAGHQLLYEQPARKALQLLPALGDLVHVESYFSFRTVRRSPGGRLPLSADLQLLDILPHPVYLLLAALEAAVPKERSELASVEVGPAGTVHALVRRGRITATLVVTLEGRPVESYLRLVGTNGTVHADFVRGTVQRLIGPGISGIDKAANPFRLGWQIISGTTTALGERAVKRQLSYPGLAELFEAFYASILSGGAPPLSPASIVETTRIWEEIAHALESSSAASSLSEPRSELPRSGTKVLITGGTGFLGKEVARALALKGAAPTVVSRRAPAAWDRLEGVHYITADLSEGLPDGSLRDVDIVIHCAAETAGGWDEHQKNSIDASERLMRDSAAAGVKRVIHVSSLAVISAGKGQKPLSEDSPIVAESRTLGPYVWGKAESERVVSDLGQSLGIGTRIVRPGALLDYRAFEPPGRLGKRLGNIFVAVGGPGDALGVVEVEFAARVLAWMTEHFEESPEVLNLLAPTLPTRRQLVSRLRRSNPDLTVVWLPTFAVVPLSWMAMLLQKLLRPGKPAMNVAKIFAQQRYDTSRTARLSPD